MEFRIEKIAETANSTLSKLTHNDGFFAFIVEDGYRDIKQAGQTRIPGGRYEIIPKRHGEHFEKYRQRYGHKFSVELKDVPGFKNILIHIGNTVKDTQGCPLVNMGAALTKDGVWMGSDSATAYLKLYGLLEPAFEAGERVFVEIER